LICTHCRDTVLPCRKKVFGSHLYQCSSVCISSACIAMCCEQFVCVCLPGGARRPSHQDSSGNFAPHVTNDKDMHERRPGEEAAFRHDYPDLGENEIKCLTVRADSTVDVYFNPSSDISAFSVETVMAVFA